MKTAIAIIGLAGALAFSTAAVAQGNSEPGEDRYNEIRQNANPDAQCGTGALSGAFGLWGKDFNRGIQSPTEHPDRGAGTDHGFYNTEPCGNAPDSAPPD